MWTTKLDAGPAREAVAAPTSIDALLEVLRKGLTYADAAQSAERADTARRAEAKARAAYNDVNRQIMKLTSTLSAAQLARAASGLQKLAAEIAEVERKMLSR